MCSALWMKCCAARIPWSELRQVRKFLRKLLTNHSLCFAATHDLELTELLKDSYDNYHFEEEVKDGDVHFNYRLMNGRATTRNAIKLLSAFGYDEDIIKGAGRRADKFLQTGQWK